MARRANKLAATKIHPKYCVLNSSPKAFIREVAVAREYKLLSRDELPMLEQVGIMTGDRIDLQGSFIDNSKPKKPKTAEASPAPATVAPAVERATAAITTVTPEVTIVPVTVNPVVSPNAPVTPAAQTPKTAELVEKTADSDNNSRNE